MSKKGGGSQTTTQETQFLPGQKEFFSNLFNQIGPMLGNAKDVKYPVADPVANAGVDTVAAQQGVRDIVGSSGADFSKSVLGANDFLLSKVLFPDSNPALQGTINAAINPVQDRLMRQILPGIRAGYTSGDSVGSTRQGLAEGTAIGDFTRNALDATSQIANNGYNSGLEAMTKALALSPTTFNAALSPNAALSAVGAQQDQQAQAEINGQVTKSMFDTFGPLSYLSQLANIGATSPVARTTAHGPAAQGPGIGSSLLGGAAGGAGLASMLGMSTPWGAGIGAVLSLFG